MLKTKHWTEQQDDFLRSIVPQGKKNWVQISQIFNSKFFSKKKNPKQCRQRFVNYSSCSKQHQQLNQWSNDQINKMLLFYEQFGSKWTKISQLLKGKTENSIKNKFYCITRKLMRKMNQVGKYKLILKKQLKQKSIRRVLDFDLLINLPKNLRQKSVQIRKKIINYANQTNGLLPSDQMIVQLINQMNQFNFQARNYRFRKKQIRQQTKNESDKYSKPLKNLNLTENLNYSEVQRKRVEETEENIKKNNNSLIQSENEYINHTLCLVDQQMMQNELRVKKNKNLSEDICSEIMIENLNESPLSVENLL